MDQELTPLDAAAQAETVRRPTVLVVEDDPAQREILRRLLERIDIDVSVAPDGRTAVERVPVVDPDLVIMDVEMPGMDGFEATRRILAQHEGVPPTVLFLTGHASPQAVVHGLDLGGVDYVAKPYNPAVLQARVQAAVRMRRQIVELASRVSIDPLTGLLNRHELKMRGEQIVASAERSRRPFAAVMIDVDRFKEINDTFGHAAGDEALRHVAVHIASTVRRSSSVFRLGGDEFLVLEPDSDAEAGARLAERIRSEVAAQRLDALSAGGEAVRKLVTISAGVAAWRPGLTLDDVVDEADRALLAAKALGRDRVRSNGSSKDR